MAPSSGERLIAFDGRAKANRFSSADLSLLSIDPSDVEYLESLYDARH